MCMCVCVCVCVCVWMGGWVGEASVPLFWTGCSLAWSPKSTEPPKPCRSACISVRCALRLCHNSVASVWCWTHPQANLTKPHTYKALTFLPPRAFSGCPQLLCVSCRPAMLLYALWFLQLRTMSSVSFVRQ